MRNKDLMEQNFSLFEELQKALHDIDLLKEQVASCQAEIELLKNGACFEDKVSKVQEETEDTLEETIEPEVEAEDAEEAENQVDAVVESEPSEFIPMPLGVNINANPNADYGSEAIGKIIVKSNEYVAKKPQSANLIFGKTEMAKAEIMSIISSEISLQQKRDEIDIVLSQAEEYFESVDA